VFRRAFPDSYFTVEDMIAEADKVMTRKTFRGTHGGELMGPRPADGGPSGSSTSCASSRGGWWSTGPWETTSA
jgi:hypothetical protein